MNTYYKFCPNVFLAKCDAKHEKGETILVTTKYGKENESIVFNLIFERDGFYYYSIVRADGFNVSERQNAGWIGLPLQNERVKNTSKHQTKTAIFSRWVNLLKSAIIAKDDTEKPLKMPGIIWERA